MLRVHDLDRAVAFYAGRLGMTVLRRQDFKEGRFTLAFLGYGPESETSVIELTHNWDDRDYTLGDAFGHLAVEVDDVHRAVEHLAQAGVPVSRAPGPLKGDTSQIIAFVKDPDGYAVELIQRRAWSGEDRP
jgi:lactoylglutathione lyase